MTDKKSKQDDNPVRRFEHPSDALTYMRELTQIGIRTLDIFSHSLSPALYSDQELAEAITHLIKYSSRSKVRILIRNTKHLYGTSVALLSLAQRIPSKVSIRLYLEGAKDPDMGFFCVDLKHLVYFNNELSFNGFSRRNAKPESSKVLDEFEHLWIYGSKEDPNLKKLCL